MILVEPGLITKIDRFASEELSIPTLTLMHRAGEAVARVVRNYTARGGRVRIFAGKGNNGGDGYAAALLLMDEYDVKVYDVFSMGQRTDEGKHFLSEFLNRNGIVESLDFSEEQIFDIESSETYVDAIFGTGFVGEMPISALRIAGLLSSYKDKNIIAIDVPLGVNASDGSVTNGAVYQATATVTLGFVKTGLVSYPAKKYVGKLINDNIGLHNDRIIEYFNLAEKYIDEQVAVSMLPTRENNSSKGSFGKLLLACGSKEYPGAAHLSLEAALRGGVGLVTYLGEQSLCDSLLRKFPEAIYKPFSLPDADEKDLQYPLHLSLKHSAVLIGPGASKSVGLYHFVKHILCTEGCSVVLDADAINVLSENGEEGLELLKNSKRTVILTPHPLELARLCSVNTEDIQNNRLTVALNFAEKHNCVLVLKGAATIVTDGKRTYINSSGSSALAKAGSGDVLAGFMASMIASGIDPIDAAVISVYFHGLAADKLSEEYSALGVTPSDLPKEIARQISKATKNKQHKT